MDQAKPLILCLIYFMCFTLIIYTEGRKSIGHITYTKIVSDFSPKYIRNFSATISEDRQIVNNTVDIKRNLTSDIWFKCSLAQRDGNSHGYKNMFSYNVNACQLIRAGKGVSLIHFWIENFYKVSNLPKGCPIKEGNYYWTILPDKSGLPKFMKSGYYRISTEFYVRDWHNDFLVNFTVYSDLKMK